MYLVIRQKFLSKIITKAYCATLPSIKKKNYNFSINEQICYYFIHKKLNKIKYQIKYKESFLFNCNATIKIVGYRT